MNIFVTSPDPYLSAIFLDNQRLVKMVLETGQLLSGAMNVLYPDHGKPLYKTSHINHPCSIWARESKANFDWLMEHFVELSKEYEHRYNREHKTFGLLNDLIDVSSRWSDGKGLTPFANCTEFKDISDVHEAYRLQMIKKWSVDKRAPSWGNREKPIWAK